MNHDPTLPDPGGLLRAALLRMGLIDPDEDPVLCPLTGGVSSTILRVDTWRAVFCIKQALPELKVASHWSAPLERNHAEVAWIQQARQILPDAVPAILGEDPTSYSFAMEWLDPDTHPVWKAQLRDGQVELNFAAQVGQRLALLHAASADQPMLAKRFAYDQNFFALRLDPYFGAAALAHPDCAPMLLDLIDQTAAHKNALVHGDISPKNILAGPRGPIFLDAECAWYGDPAFDAAFCLCHLLAKCIWRPAWRDAYLASFDAFAEAYLAGVNWEPRAAIEARIARLLAAILLARVDGKSPLEYLLTEQDKQRQRQFARRFVLRPAQQLALLRAEWNKECQP